MLEAEQDSHVNKIADLRTLLRRVNKEGEKRITFIKNKNVALKDKISALEAALTISRENSQHFEQVKQFWQESSRSCWSYCGCYCYCDQQQQEQQEERE